MPANSIAMRQIRETLRLLWQARPGYAELSTALKASNSALRKCFSLARASKGRPRPEGGPTGCEQLQRQPDGCQRAPFQI